MKKYYYRLDNRHMSSGNWGPKQHRQQSRHERLHFHNNFEYCCTHSILHSNYTEISPIPSIHFRNSHCNDNHHKLKQNFCLTKNVNVPDFRQAAANDDGNWYGLLEAYGAKQVKANLLSHAPKTLLHLFSHASQLQRAECIAAHALLESALQKYSLQDHKLETPLTVEDSELYVRD